MSPQIAVREIKGDGRLDWLATSPVSPPPAQVTPPTSGLYTPDIICLSEYKWSQSWQPVPADLKGSDTQGGVGVRLKPDSQNMPAHYGWN